MIGLVGVELGRLCARRRTGVATLLLLAAVGVIQVVVYLAIVPASTQAVADNRRFYGQGVQDWVVHHQQWEQECIAEAGLTPAQCATTPPTLDAYAVSLVPFATTGPVAVAACSYLTLLVSCLLAASVIGAGPLDVSPDGRSPVRPGRSLGSKLIATVILGTGLGLVANGLTAGLAILQAEMYGVVGTADPTDLVLVAGRGVVLVVLGATIGLCLRLATRGAGAVLAAVLVVLGLAYVYAVATHDSATVARLAPWLPGVNLSAFLHGGHTYQVPTPRALTPAPPPPTPSPSVTAPPTGWWCWWRCSSAPRWRSGAGTTPVSDRDSKPVPPLQHPGWASRPLPCRPHPPP